MTTTKADFLFMKDAAMVRKDGRKYEREVIYLKLNTFT